MLQFHHTRRSILFLCATAVLFGAMSVGCMSDEERIEKMIGQAIEKCREAEGPFHDVTLFDRNKRTVLSAACHEPASAVEMPDKLTGILTTGPLVWRAGQGRETSAWVLTEVSWEALDRARRTRADSDLPVDALERAEELLAQAQGEFDKSPWLRLERLENLLDLRVKSRTAADPEPETIGPAAQAYFEETLAWAKENDEAHVAARAQILVVNHLRQYQRRQKVALDSIGSQNEWLERAIDMALKEGDREEAANIRKDLDERIANAVVQRETVNRRLETVHTNICAAVGALSVTGISDNELRTEILSLGEGIKCTIGAEADEEDKP